MLGNHIESRAILLHHNTTTRAVEVTSHDILSLPSTGFYSPGYTLGAGRVFGVEEKNELREILDNEASREGLSLLPDTLLAKAAHAVVWWMPSAQRELCFRDGKSVRRMTVTMPNTVAAMCRGTLYVAAFMGTRSQRPDHATKLYRIPLPNLTGEYQFCLGNCHIPTEALESNIPTWEAFIWESRNTHLGREPVKGASSLEKYLEFMSRLDGTGRFPRNKLVPTGHTLGEWLCALDKNG